MVHKVWKHLVRGALVSLSLRSLRLREEFRARRSRPRRSYWRQLAPFYLAAEVQQLEPRCLLSAPTLSDTFNRANSANQLNLGAADNGLGGSGTNYYEPIFANGADLVSNALVNHGQDFGGVQLTAVSGGAGRGESVGQDINIAVNLLVPTDFL